MRLYIIRHADPDYPNHTITPAGHREADALARRMAAAGLTHLYTSPLERARHTAQYTADLTKLEPVVVEWTRELSEWAIVLPDLTSGDQRRYAAWDVHGEIVRGVDPLPTDLTWDSLDLFDGRGLRDRFDTLIAASDAFLAEHGLARSGHRYRLVDGAPTDQVAVFCHNGFGLTWLAHLLALPLTLAWSAFWLPPSSVTTVLFDVRSDAWAVPRCLGVGDVGHLHAARLPVQPRGIVANYH